MVDRYRVVFVCGGVVLCGCGVGRVVYRVGGFIYT